MANNLTSANDRLLAFQLLAEAFAEQGNPAGAQSSARQVEMAVAAMPPTHRPMAWYWTTKAAHAASLRSLAERAALASLDAALTIEGDGWDVPNGLFWAASAARLVDNDQILARIRSTLDSELDNMQPFRNQVLQTASVSGHHAFLRARLLEWRQMRYPSGAIRDGNIALALADAGMTDELDEVIDIVRRSPGSEEPDATKRWAWALALRGRMGDAIEVIQSIHNPNEQMKAIARVADVAHDREDIPVLDQLASIASECHDAASVRSRARVVRVWWQAGRYEEALTLAENVAAATHQQNVVLDPREDEDSPDPAMPAFSSHNTGQRQTIAAKTSKRELVTSVVPVEDDQRSRRVTELARSGDLNQAETLTDEIAVPVFRARAFAALARYDSRPDRRLHAWLRAMHSARATGRGAVTDLESLGFEILEGASRDQEVVGLKAALADLDVAWELEHFAEQYAILRRTLSPGEKRTARMTALLLTARVSSNSDRWQPNDITRAWATGDDGRRLFVLGLIQGNPSLAAPEVLVEGIRSSRSAFEQYHALRAALACDLAGQAADAVYRAVRDETDQVPRADGSPSQIGSKTERAHLAQRLLSQLT